MDYHASATWFASEGEESYQGEANPCKKSPMPQSGSHRVILLSRASPATLTRSSHFGKLA